MSRRNALVGLVVLGLMLAAIPGFAQKPYQGQTLRIAMWGAGWNRGLHELVGKPFMERTGAKIDYVIGNPREHLAKMLATRGQEPPFDVVQVDDSVKEQMVRLDLVQPVELAKIPNVKHVFPTILDKPELGPSFMIIPIGIGYNTEKFKELGLAEPTSWDILWEPKLAGKVAIPDLNVVMGVHTLMGAAIRASGNPYNYEAGIQELKKIKLNHIYSSPVEILTQITSANVWAVPITEGRINELRFRGVPVKYVNPVAAGKKGSMDIDSIHVVKGSKRKELAEIYMNLLLEPAAQLGFARAEGWTPAVRPAAAAIQKDAALREKFTILDEAGVNAALRADWGRLNRSWGDIVTKWNRTLKQ